MKLLRHCLLTSCVAISMTARAQTAAQPEAAKQTSVPEIQAVPRLFEPTVLSPEPSAPNVPASVGRPILFVHGWCGNDFSWLVTVELLRNQLMSANPSLYQNAQIFGAYFRGFNGGVQFYDLQTFSAISQAQIPASARFFVIELIDARQTGATAPFDKGNVAQIPIAVKANEVAEVLTAIQDVTYIEDAIVVAHSMGGLVTRAYLEGLGSPLVASNGQYFYTPGTLAFNRNLGSIITVDTPHAGAPVSLSEALLGGFSSCQGLNRHEMIPGDSSSVVESLNYVANASLNGASARSIPSTFPIHSIKSYNTFDWGGTPNSDGVLGADTQDIRLSLQGHLALSASLQTLDNFKGPIPALTPECSYGFFYVLHFIECIGEQTSTLNLILQSVNADMLGVPLGVLSITFPSTLVGGSGSLGSVVLTTGAPVHGAFVQLTSDDPSVQVPASLTLAPGASSAQFNLATSSVTATKTVHVTATYGRTPPQIATIALQPAVAQVQVSSTLLNFNNQLLNLRSAGQQLLVTNTGVASLTIGSIAASGDFEQSNNCPTTLTVNASCAINIVFRPHELGPEIGALTIVDNAPGSPHTVSLTGTAFDITLNVPRPTRTRRGTGGAAARQEVTAELSPVGTALDVPIQLECVSSECGITKIQGSNSWNVFIRSARASRLALRSREVIVRATVLGESREFPIAMN